MAEITQTLTAKDKLQLFIRAWLTETPKASIALVHGFGEHSGRYAHVADFFNKNGYSFFAFDNRGHGQSEGKRGHAPDYDAYLYDIDVFWITLLPNPQVSLFFFTAIRWVEIWY